MPLIPTFHSGATWSHFQITLLTHFADTVHSQEFNLTCDREINGTTGLITYTFKWTLGPSDLPFELSEALEELTLDYNKPLVNSNGIRYNTSTFGSVRRLLYLLDDRLVPAVVTLEQNISGSLQLVGVMPSFVKNMTGFEVKTESISFWLAP